MLELNQDDNLNININSDMNTKLKKVELFLESKFIFCTKSWLKEKIETYNNISKLEEKIYQEVLNSEISTFIDKEKVNSYCKLSDHFSFDTKIKIMNKKIFFQITNYTNIAESHEKGENGADNLDVVDNFESKYLQSEGEEIKKTGEKILLKFELTNGVDNVTAFEYEDLKDIKKILMNKELKDPKVLIGPNYEVRRGIIYLKNNNITLL